MPASHVISTMPMRELVHTITPPPPPEVVAAADDLHYRDYLTVALVVPEARSFPDNWIYIHATDVEVGPHPELRVVVALPRQGRADLPRSRVLRLRGRRHVEHARRRADRAGHQGAHLARPGRRGRRRARLRRPGAQGLPVLRLQLQGRTSRRSASGSTPRRPTSIPSGATGCTSTTTRTTPCTRPC